MGKNKSCLLLPVRIAFYDTSTVVLHAHVNLPRVARMDIQCPLCGSGS